MRFGGRIMLTFVNRFIEGWSIIVRAIWTLIKLFFESFELFWELITGRKKRGQPWDCFNIPDLRARPDPYIYSQFWLFIRGLAFTWDNPDFAIIDPDDGGAVDNHQLKPNKKYFVRATVHNGSIMTAVNTSVSLEVLQFGAGTITTQALGSVVIDVPALGSAVSEFEWMTPETAGHNCLRATIVHLDDANPLNNVGQHNTDVAIPASATRKLKFYVGNHSPQERTYSLSMNSYRLPEQPMQPSQPQASVFGNIRRDDLSRTSLGYLRRLQEVNDFAKFPTPSFLEAKLEHTKLRVQPGEDIETFVEMTAPHVGQGRQNVNVNVMLDGMLVGGVTAYVEEV
jgi:hypothetical protein